MTPFEAEQATRREAAAAAHREGFMGFVTALAIDTRDFVSRALAPRDARLDAIETRLAELEARPVVTYKGVWAGDLSYGHGDLVTCNGNIWHSNVHANRAKPGEHPHWTLAVRKGRDAR